MLKPTGQIAWIRKSIQSDFIKTALNFGIPVIPSPRSVDDGLGVTILPVIEGLVLCQQFFDIHRDDEEVWMPLLCVSDAKVMHQ